MVIGELIVFPERSAPQNCASLVCKFPIKKNDFLATKPLVSPLLPAENAKK